MRWENLRKIPLAGFGGRFFFRLAITLAIELLLALIFGFRRISSLKIIALTNTATQIILNIIILFTTLFNVLLAALFVLVIAELFVIALELAVYLKFLAEKNVLRRTVYTFAANLSSVAAGFMLFFIENPVISSNSSQEVFHFYKLIFFEFCFLVLYYK